VRAQCKRTDFSSISETRQFASCSIIPDVSVEFNYANDMTLSISSCHQAGSSRNKKTPSVQSDGYFNHQSDAMFCTRMKNVDNRYVRLSNYKPDAGARNVGIVGITLC